MGITRRKWFRRGQALMDFAIAVVSVPVAALLHVFWRAAVTMRASVAKLRKRSRGQSAVQPDRVGPPRHAPREEAAAAASALAGAEPAFSPLAVRPSVTFDSVVGLKDAKREIRLRTILPLKYPDQAGMYGVHSGGGLLLFGPPGCGKTLLAAATANELEAAVFLHIRPSDLITNNVGASERKIAELYRYIASAPSSVLFLDEVDSLVPSRRANSSTIMRRVISEFLSQMDGLEKKRARSSDEGFRLAIFATNWPEGVDPAFLRPGRCDVRIFVGLPDTAARKGILHGAFTGRPVAADVDLGVLVSETEGYSGADLVALVDAAARLAFLNAVGPTGQRTPVSWRHVASASTQVRPSVTAADLARYERARGRICGRSRATAEAAP